MLVLKREMTVRKHERGPATGTPLPSALLLRSPFYSGRPAPWSASPSSSAAPPALLPDVRPLGLQKWQVPMSPHAAGPLRGGPRCGVVCCGARPRDLYALLQVSGPRQPVC